MPDSALYLNALETGFARWGYLVMFGALFLECVPVVGFAVPGLTILVAAGFWATTLDGTHAMGLLAAASAGVVASDTSAYAVGRLSRGRLSVVQRAVKRHDGLRRRLAEQALPVLIFYQFPPYSRMFAPLLLGVIDLALGRWVALVCISTALFVLAFFGLGYVVGWSGRALANAIDIAGLVTTVFVGGLVWWGIVFYRQRGSRSKDT